MTRIQILLRRAKKTFRVAEGLLRDDAPEDAAARVYYGYFYVAQALLLTEGLRFSSHGQILGQYGLRFAQPEKLDRRFHRLLRRAFELRQVADYQVEIAIDPDNVAELIEEGKAFLAAAVALLRRSYDLVREQQARKYGTA
ncbi:MAG TPA: HEPN domain-containing protein, partial [Thermoanaerobaculia bacterium]|nr:HEPN domain-containing protein [Thermoanaerobaculia bacterium]